MLRADLACSRLFYIPTKVPLRTIALYWCDGRRNLAEVARLTQLELGPTDFDFVAYFRFLRNHGYVQFK